MESKLEPVEGQPCRRTLKLSVPSERVDEKFEQSWAELRNHVTLPGFRRGKAPRSLLVKRYGDDVANDVKRDLVVEAIEEGVRKHELELVRDPELDFESIAFEAHKPIDFEVTLEVKPDFELPDYKGVAVTRSVEAVSDDDVEQVIENVRRRGAARVPVEDGEVEDGDHVLGTIALVKDGEEVFRQHGAAVIGKEENVAGVPMPGLSEGLLGKTSGDGFTCSTEVPENFPVKDVRGLEVEATFTIEEMKRVEMPEVDDDLAKGLGFDDLASFRERVVADLGKREQEIADHKVEEAVIDDILGRVSFPLPPSVVESTMRSRLRERLMEMLYAGELEPEGIVDAERKVREELTDDVERALRAWYVIEKVAKKERLFATERDIQHRIEQLAAEHGTTPTRVREELAKKEQLDSLRHQVLERKVRLFLAQNAKVTDAPAEAPAKGEAKAKSTGKKKAESKGTKKKGASNE